MRDRGFSFAIGDRRSALILPVLSGLLLIAIQPPVSLWFLAYVALVPLLFALEGVSPRGAFLRGYVAGFVSFLGILHWVVVAMHRYGGIPVAASVTILILFAAYLALYVGAAAAAAKALERRFFIPLYVTFPLLWTIAEYLRGIALTGFPWGFVAHSHHQALPLIQVASVTGTYFLSFLIVAANGIIHSFLRRRRPHMAYTLLIAILFAGSVAFGISRMGDVAQGNLSALIVQGNVRQDLKWDRSFLEQTVKIHFNRTLEGGGGTDLIVWPETSMPFAFQEKSDIGEAIGALAARVNGDIVFGTITRDGEGKVYNSAYLAGTGVRPFGRYDKVHLVPFGEYIPVVSRLPFLERLTAASGAFVAGSSHAPLRGTKAALGVLICYEGVFPAETAEKVRSGAQVLINMTNDAWFGRTSAPYQHLAAYVFRAVETDRYVLRAANTGISAIVDNRGRVLGRTDIFREETLRGSFAAGDSRTLYVRFGDYFIILVCVALVCTIASVRAFGSSRRG